MARSMGAVAKVTPRMEWWLGAAALVVSGVGGGAAELPANLDLELVADGFSRPVAVRSAGDGSDRLFVVEQDGRIMVVADGEVLAGPFLDIVPQVESGGGEQGLLGLAFHPDYSNNGFFYVNYTHDPGPGPDVTRVSRFEVSAADPDVADPASQTILLEFEQDFSNHNGGDLHFGPDGLLYIATGDGGGAGDPNDRAQDLGTLLGKLLRIDVDGAAPYAVPPDNPFVGAAGARPEIWAYGLRNPWRFSFDRLTGDVFIGDVGQGAVEEVDFQPAASTGGENYGWSCMEGDRAAGFNPCDGSPLTPPILVYGHGLGCSVTGGYRYRGRIAALRGFYVFGDFCSGRIWLASESGGAWSAELWADTDVSISSFGEDEGGELYLTDLARGELHRFTAPPEAELRRSAGRRLVPGGGP
ncbi:MAG TPA: PQQ-dependent sugar dehydrogenase [Chondromyces sp.]|nr:PQQ-dependent sugar dehydrogenase [Chondromyces sp.]